MLDSSEDRTISDSAGTLVRVGSLVRVIQIPEFTTEALPQPERERVLSMSGEIFEVYEIDEQGQAWVEKWCNRCFSTTLYSAV